MQALHDWLALEDVGQPAVVVRVTKSDTVVYNDGKAPKGPRRLTPQSVALVIKKYAQTLELDPTLLAGHSLRRGWLTSASGQPNADLIKLAERSRHKSIDILRGYIDDARKLTRHAGEGLL